MEHATIGNWRVDYNPKPIPDRRFDYDATHDDFDGENGLCFSCASVEDARKEIDDMGEEFR